MRVDGSRRATAHAITVDARRDVMSYRRVPSRSARHAHRSAHHALSPTAATSRHSHRSVAMARRPTSAEQLAELIEGIDIAMLTTAGPDGWLVSRPLSTQAADFDGERIWFFTEADSPKIGEIRRRRKVNVAYASKDANTYVSVAGQARINRDRAKIESLWNDALKAFFPKGVNDPNLVLLEVEVRSAEYWTGPRTGIGKLLAFVAARVTKKEELMGENRILDLKPGAKKKSLRPPSDKSGGGRSKAAVKKAAAGVLTRKRASGIGRSSTVH
jgi:general stress protein 26